jgi:hypothetical protein
MAKSLNTKILLSILSAYPAGSAGAATYSGLMKSNAILPNVRSVLGRHGNGTIVW